MLFSERTGSHFDPSTITYRHVLCLSGDHQDAHDHLLLDHVPEIIHRSRQWPLRSDVLSLAAAVERRANEVSVHVIRRRIVLQDHSRSIVRENVLESISCAILWPLAVLLLLSRRLRFRGLIELPKFERETTDVARHHGHGFREILALLMNIASVERRWSARLPETKSSAIRGNETIVYHVEMYQFVQGSEKLNFRA